MCDFKIVYIINVTFGKKNNTTTLIQVSHRFEHEINSRERIYARERKGNLTKRQRQKGETYMQ